MPEHCLPDRSPSSLLCVPRAFATLILLCLSSPVTAQDTAATAVAFAMDSSRAAAAACKVVQSLREEPRRHRCHVERFTETAAEYVIRVREVPRDGTRPPPFSRSTVQIRKTEPSVTVTRVPEL